MAICKNKTMRKADTENVRTEIHRNFSLLKSMTMKWYYLGHHCSVFEELNLFLQ